MGRPTKLTPEVQDAICADLEAGLPRVTAARRVGISASTFRSWVQRGRTGHARDAEFLAFLAAVKKAEADAEARNVARIDAAAQGGQVVETVTVTRADGSTSVTERRAPPQWTAAAWLLERKHPLRWGVIRGQLEKLTQEIRELRKMVGGEESGRADAGGRPAAQGAGGGTPGTGKVPRTPR